MISERLIPPAAAPVIRPGAVRHLVAAALQQVRAARGGSRPRDREGWVAHLCEALMSEAETSHHAAVAALMASGVSSDDFFAEYVPAAARRLGALWVQDRANFVAVTLGAGRLQALTRGRLRDGSGAYDRCIPLGESFLMVIPAYEDHALGAFLAADQLRRHGVWVHMAIQMPPEELAALIATRRFAAVGLTAATPATVDRLGETIADLRNKLDPLPPIVVGGRAVSALGHVAERTGADFAVETVREAVEHCGLSSLGASLNPASPA
jgi:hypothetical protein